MIFGTAIFKCNDCGERFVSTAIEWNATVYLTPMPCPKCGSVHTYPANLSNAGGILGPGFYRKIWEKVDKK